MDDLDGGFSRNVIVALSRKVDPTTATTVASVVAASGGIVPSATNVATTTVNTVMQRVDMSFGPFHHHAMVPTQVTSVVALPNAAIIGHAAMGAGIASAAVFALKLGWDLFQYARGNISPKELKMRTIKSFVSNASVCGFGIGGSAIGTMILPGVGTIVGGIVGSIIGAGLSMLVNKKIDKNSGQNYSQFDFDLPDNPQGPQQILKEAALMFGFKQKYLKDPKIFNIKAVKRRYKKLATEFHPDHHGNHQLFIEFHTNYTILLKYLNE